MTTAAIDDKGTGEQPPGSSPGKQSPSETPGSGDTDLNAGSELDGVAVPYSRFARHRVQFRQVETELEAERKARITVEEENDRLKAIHGGEVADEELDPTVQSQLTATSAVRKAERAEARVDAVEKARVAREEFKDQEKAFTDAVEKHPEIANDEMAYSLAERAYWFSIIAMGDDVDAGKFMDDAAQVYGKTAKSVPNDRLRGLPDDPPVPKKTEGRYDVEDRELAKKPFHTRMAAKMKRARNAASARLSAGDKKTAGL